MEENLDDIFHSILHRLKIKEYKPKLHLLMQIYESKALTEFSKKDAEKPINSIVEINPDGTVLKPTTLKDRIEKTFKLLTDMVQLRSLYARGCNKITWVLLNKENTR